MRHGTPGWRPGAMVALVESGLVPGDLFDLAMKDEVDAVVGDELPFGDPLALARLAREIADVLKVRLVSRLDPRALRPCHGALGLHNTAVWVRADDGRRAHRSLLNELEKLALRQNWAKTAAACLVPARPNLGNPARQTPKEATAAPLLCNGSQELTLERLRREPLTVVTGPPGTGKTQLSECPGDSGVALRVGHRRGGQQYPGASRDDARVKNLRRIPGVRMQSPMRHDGLLSRRTKRRSPARHVNRCRTSGS